MSNDLDLLLGRLAKENPAKFMEMALALGIELPAEKTVREKARPKGSVDRILETVTICKLCGSFSTQYHRISWDALQGVYTTKKVPAITPEVVPTELRSDCVVTCADCQRILLDRPKETLVQMLIEQAQPLFAELNTARRSSELRNKLREEKRRLCYDI